MMENNSVNEGLRKIENKEKEKVDFKTEKSTERNGEKYENKKDDINEMIYKKSWNLGTGSFEWKSVKELLKNPRIISQARTYISNAYVHFSCCTRTIFSSDL